MRRWGCHWRVSDPGCLLHCSTKLCYPSASWCINTRVASVFPLNSGQEIKYAYFPHYGTIHLTNAHFTAQNAWKVISLRITSNRHTEVSHRFSRGLQGQLKSPILYMWALCNKAGLCFLFSLFRTPVVLICWDQLEVKHVLFWLQAAGIHLHHRNTLRTSVIKSRCICRELFSHKHTQALIMPEEKHIQMNMYSKAEKKIHETTEQKYQLKCLCTPTHS